MGQGRRSEYHCGCPAPHRTPGYSDSGYINPDHNSYAGNAPGYHYTCANHGSDYNTNGYPSTAKAVCHAGPGNSYITASYPGTERHAPAGYPNFYPLAYLYS